MVTICHRLLGVGSLLRWHSSQVRTSRLERSSLGYGDGRESKHPRASPATRVFCQYPFKALHLGSRIIRKHRVPTPCRHSVVPGCVGVWSRCVRRTTRTLGTATTTHIPSFKCLCGSPRCRNPADAAGGRGPKSRPRPGSGVKRQRPSERMSTSRDRRACHACHTRGSRHGAECLRCASSGEVPGFGLQQHRGPSWGCDGGSAELSLALHPCAAPAVAEPSVCIGSAPTGDPPLSSVEASSPAVL